MQAMASSTSWKRLGIKLARHHLNNSLLALNETAYLLGYEDSTSFLAVSASGKEFLLSIGVKPME
jgi:hypothetical protein